MSTKGTFLSWIVVSDIKEARKFFTETLGFKELCFVEEYKWAEFQGKEGGSIIGVAEQDPQMKAGSNSIITFTVDDVVKAKKELSAKGAKMIGDIIEVPGHVKMQTFCDKDGNHFQIAESLEQ